MDLEKLEQDIQQLVDDLDEESFIYALLLTYGLPKATITRLKNGDRNQSKKPGEIIWKKNLCFTDQPEGDLFTCIDALKSDPAVKKHHPRFIVVTDYETFLAIDTKTDDSLDIAITELPKRANFFLPWAGMEKSAITSESPADIKAAEKMGQLYDLLLHNNEIEDDESRHALNVFLSRLLFCFFAEDTGIFDDDQFTKLVDSHTVEDGSNLQALLERLFKALNAKDRSDYPEYIRAFPYVNGGLFADDLPVPAFSRKSRKMLTDCGALNWKAINPDIFGSMMQAVTLGEERSSIGMHYTSVVNIMKVIEPLFLNDLKEQMEKAAGNEKKLEKLLYRLYHTRVFDPACGSGNFLIIAYKELCRLEIDIFQQLQVLNASKWGIARPGIQLNQFYGIEIDDFAAETARLSLWLAEHQMNIEFREVFGESRPSLPLVNSGIILCASATRVAWDEFCPKELDFEIYVLGNPPYLGQKKQSAVQKEDLRSLFAGAKSYKALDYISCWFVKAAEYLDSRIRVAFVSTNSIVQGSHVSLLWPYIYQDGKNEIFFAYRDFPWANSAKGNAGVTCVIVGLRTVSSGKKYIYEGGRRLQAQNINSYLVDFRDFVVSKASKALCNVPALVYGNMALDDGHLLLSDNEKRQLLNDYPEADRFIRETTGANEFINGLTRWCLWIDDEDLEEARAISPIRERIEACLAFRKAGGDVARTLVDRPHQFRYRRVPQNSQIIVPLTTSSRREYLPIGFLPRDVVVQQTAQVLYDPETYIFSIISSHMHMLWVRSVGGKLQTGLRYSASICYNAFPFPELELSKKEYLETSVFNIVEGREKYSELTMAQLYDPDKMPTTLKEAHFENDRLVESCYSNKSFKGDDERLEHLFECYEKLVAN